MRKEVLEANVALIWFSERASETAESIEEVSPNINMHSTLRIASLGKGI